MGIARSIASALRRLMVDRRGNVAIIFGLAVVPLLLAAGSAVDIARGYVTRTRLQTALDAAALAAAAARHLSDEDRIALGQVVFDANYQVTSLSTAATPVFELDGTTLSASVSTSIDTTLMNIAGVAELNVGSSVEITIPSMRDAEIALVLDYSLSMDSNGKYQTMRDAAIELVDTLTQGDDADHVQFGLVPFSHHVYATLPSAYVEGEAPGGTWTGCTYDRMYPYNTQAATPDPGDDETKWGIEVPGDPHNSWGCGGYLARDLVVQPLTFDHAAITGQLEDMTPYAWTNIALGMSFGWHLLTPNAPFEQGSDDPEVLKAIVLLTDGVQTQKSWGPGGSRSVSNGEDNLEAMCEAAKDDGILVITVAFDLNDADTEDRLHACATSDDHFYVADDNDALASAFDDISGQLVSELYISR